MFLVMTLNKKMGVTLGGAVPNISTDIKICWADGMIGAIPVFETREDAEKYANGRQIIEANND